MRLFALEGLAVGRPRLVCRWHRDADDRLACAWRPDNETAGASRAGWLVEGLLSQTLIVHNIRTEKIPVFQSTAAPPVVLLTTTIMAVGMAIPFSPLGAAIGLQRCRWLLSLAGQNLAGLLLLIQAVRTLCRRRFGVRLRRGPTKQQRKVMKLHFGK